MTIRIEPLGKRHDRTTFTSGESVLDRWFRTQAGQKERRSVTRVFVASDDEGIVGFSTLSMFAIGLDSVPERVARKLPRYPDVPAALIGRLARAIRARGKGVGELLVADAIDRIVAATRSIAAFAIVVDAKNERARLFYERLGFIPFPTRPDRLFLLMETAASAAAKSRPPVSK
jgi:ribosomal protein S18 acetylase RimI-like enzyme